MSGDVLRARALADAEHHVRVGAAVQQRAEITGDSVGAGACARRLELRQQPFGRGLGLRHPLIKN